MGFGQNFGIVIQWTGPSSCKSQHQQWAGPSSSKHRTLLNNGQDFSQNKVTSSNIFNNVQGDKVHRNCWMIIPPWGNSLPCRLQTRKSTATKEIFFNILDLKYFTHRIDENMIWEGRIETCFVTSPPEWEGRLYSNWCSAQSQQCHTPQPEVEW